MCLKRNRKKFLYLFVVFLLLNTSLLNAIENSKFFQQKIFEYLSDTKNFTSNFLQTNGKSVEEGSIYINNKRIRVEYTSPSKIRIIMNNKKAMYFNIDLQEVEYFNPKESVAEIFYNIFYNSDEFLNESKVVTKEGFVVLRLEKETEGDKININVFFEHQPFILRKIEIEHLDGVLSFGLYNINQNSVFDKEFFSMANPLIIK
tara:strand:+ start:68 stop:676 length:609 start_codon:yes stop_codon:yes gene_type:complete